MTDASDDEPVLLMNPPRRQSVFCLIILYLQVTRLVLSLNQHPPMTTEDYREQLLQVLASSRQLVETTVRKAQGWYKGQFDSNATTKLVTGLW